MAATRGTMFSCKQCGRTLEETSRFCSYCGKATDETDRQQSLYVMSQLRNLPDLSRLSKGSRIDDQYEIIARETTGGFTIVFRVLDLKDKKNKLLMIIPPLLYDNHEAMDFLVQEFKSKLWLDSPNILHVYSIQDSGELKYVTKEAFKGRTLRELKYAAPGHKLPELMVVTICIQIAGALEYAHNYNVIAGTLHPDAILINKDGLIKIDNFGMMEPLHNALNMVLNMTTLKSLVYMSPEQLTGKISSTRSDIYTFGILMFELLSGHPPFHQGDIQHQILKIKPEDIPDITPSTNLLIQKCLAKDPSKRFSQFAEIKTELEQINQKLLTSTQEESEKKKTEEKSREPAISMASQRDSFGKQVTDFWQRLNMVYRAALIGGLAVILIFIGLNIWLVSWGSRAVPEEFSPQIEAWSKINPQDRDRINELLSAADSLFMNKIYTAQDKPNAYDLYQDILSIYPHENRSIENLEYIRQDYIARAVFDINNGKFFRAESVLLDGLQHFAADSSLVSLTEKNLKLKHLFLSETPFTIEILNGAGVSGIAKRLADFLTIRNYPVINTENYRENGTVKWDVENTFIINRLGFNYRIEEMARNLGIDTIQMDTSGANQSSVNITIVMGKDYNNLRAFR